MSMKHIILLIAVLVTATACKKEKKNIIEPVTVLDTHTYIEPTPYLIEMDSLNSSTFYFKEEKAYTFTHASNGLLFFTLDFTGAIEGTEITIVSPISNIAQVAITTDANFIASDNITAIEKTHKYINMTFRYLGVLNNKPQCELSSFSY